MWDSDPLSPPSAWATCIQRTQKLQNLESQLVKSHDQIRSHFLSRSRPPYTSPTTLLALLELQHLARNSQQKKKKPFESTFPIIYPSYFHHYQLRLLGPKISPYFLHYIFMPHKSEKNQNSSSLLLI